MTGETAEAVHDSVRRSYAAIASGATNSGCCLPESSSCCGAKTPSAEDLAKAFGYSDDELASLPEGSNMGLGCGNPAAIAAMKPGETVIDLGSGGGIDCFLAAGRVGKEGRVIGIDMTPEMLKKARDNARRIGYGNVEFRLGEIENLPAADNTADVIISNCVLNLSPNKPQALREAFRVLKPGGRLAISDVVATAELPDEFKNDAELLCGCISGCAAIDQLSGWLAAAGFIGIDIKTKEESRMTIKEWAPGRGIENYVVSAVIKAVKPVL
ncbi:MAG: arsenite S-adenosylmethyltransferase [Rhodospirillales bacterium RIFCSPLOWO2_12_FULL_58_28]|nr:MAG: arsenite S-adenosylmethyltransferase [Rhodospirillales bacterium RIFCSPLOWO2_02_FULL_58_16]OHC78363.1 MAG: arsenite S-adenosylmethyltransferase [Rhodospirillales bacterium RIFCSPLOWO2_12_FULL_58_28]